MIQNKLLNIFIFSLSLISCSHNPIIEKKYYEGTDNIETEYKYYSKDKKNYDYISYYENGKIKAKGQFVDSIREGVWERWSEDGTQSTIQYYKKGKVNFANKNRKLPEIIINDSLKMGQATPVKILNLYYGEFIGIENVYRTVIDNQLYITPIQGDSVLFYYNLPEEIGFNNSCIKELSRQLEVSEEELLRSDYYRLHEIKLCSFPIYK